MGKIEDDFTGAPTKMAPHGPEDLQPPKSRGGILPAPGVPMGVARKLLNDYEQDGSATLQFWRGGWVRWRKSHWAEIEDSELRSSIHKRLEHAEFLRITSGAPEVRAWAPNKSKVADVIDAMRGITHLPESVDSPAWLNAHRPVPAGEMVACRNGLLHVGTRELLEHTPSYFNLVSVPFDYDRNSPEPKKWLEFLAQLWPDDPDSIKALQEFFGYVLSGRTDLQKIMLLVGPTRSGKSTIADLLAGLIGQGNAAARPSRHSPPTLACLPCSVSRWPWSLKRGSAGRKLTRLWDGSCRSRVRTHSRSTGSTWGRGQGSCPAGS